MPDYEYLTLYIIQQPRPEDGNGPQHVYALSLKKEANADGLHSAASLAQALESYLESGWTLVALILIENSGDSKIYEATLRRDVS